jgi:hypothetical protein
MLTMSTGNRREVVVGDANEARNREEFKVTARGIADR